MGREQKLEGGLGGSFKFDTPAPKEERK